MSQINSCCGQGSNIPNINVYLPNATGNNQQQTGIRLRINNNDNNNNSCQGSSCGNKFSFDTGNKSSSAAVNPFGNKNNALGAKNSLGVAEKQVNDFIKTITDALRADKTGEAAGQDKKVLGDFTQKDLDILRKQGLEHKGNLGANFSPELKQALSKVAVLMDNDPKAYPKPDAGSWVNEVNEDNYLNLQEATHFQDAISRVLGKANDGWNSDEVSRMGQGLLKIDPSTGKASFDEKDRDLLSRIAVGIDASKTPDKLFVSGALANALKTSNSLSKEQTEQLTKAIGEHLAKATNNQTIDKLTPGATTGSAKTNNNCTNNASSCGAPRATRANQGQGEGAKSLDKTTMEQFKVLLAAIFQLFMNLFEGNQKKV